MTTTHDDRSTADLVDVHGEALQSCDTQLRSFGGRVRFSGRIETFRSPEDNRVLKDIVSEPGDGRVIVVDAGGSLHGAMLGDNMAERAAANGWAGIVVHGVVRDSSRLAELDLGVKALGTNPRRSRKDGAGERGVDVSFGGVTFRPGDELVADEDGVVVLPSPVG